MIKYLWKHAHLRWGKWINFLQEHKRWTTWQNSINGEWWSLKEFLPLIEWDAQYGSPHLKMDPIGPYNLSLLIGAKWNSKLEPGKKNDENQKKKVSIGI